MHSFDLQNIELNFDLGKSLILNHCTKYAVATAELITLETAF